MQLRLVPIDPDSKMYCTHAGCGVDQTKFLVGKTVVEVHSLAPTMPMVVFPDGTAKEFKEGEVESVTCGKCGTTYHHADAVSAV